jgi:hypothetical protein
MEIIGRAMNKVLFHNKKERRLKFNEESRLSYLHALTNLFIFLIPYTGVPGGKINILGGHSIGHSKKKIYVNICPIPNGIRYLARNIFLPSRRNAPLSEACESV